MYICVYMHIHTMMKYDDHGKNGLSSVSDCVAHISRYLNSSVGCKTNSGNCYCWLLQWLQLFLLVPLSDRLPQFPQVRSGVKGAAPKWEQSIIKSKRARDWLRGRRWEESRRIPSRRRQLRRKTKCFHRGKAITAAVIEIKSCGEESHQNLANFVTLATMEGWYREWS